MRESIPEHVEIKGFPFIWLKFSVLSLITTSEKEKEREKERSVQTGDIKGNFFTGKVTILRYIEI